MNNRDFWIALFLQSLTIGFIVFVPVSLLSYCFDGQWHARKILAFSVAIGWSMSFIIYLAEKMEPTKEETTK